MSQYQYPYPPSQHLQLQRQKNGRLYQQLLESNYLSERLYDSQDANRNNAAHIKFSAGPLKSPFEMDAMQDRQDIFNKGAKISSANKINESTGRVNQQGHQANPSLFSNYSIVQMENQSYSTINVYSNTLQSNLDASQNITNKFLIQAERRDIYLQQERVSPNNMLLQDSRKLQQHSSLHQVEEYRRYRSQQYYNNVKEEAINEQVMQTTVQKTAPPKISADKHKKENAMKRPLFNFNQDQSNHFKTSFNDAHGMSYRINQNLQPTPFTLPINRQAANHNNYPILMPQQSVNRCGNMTLYLNNSNQSFHESQREMNSINQPSTLPPYSNEQVTNDKRHRLASNLVCNDSQKSKCNRYTAKSEPKHMKSYSNQNQTRSNSIDCKSKPTAFQMRQGNKHASSLGNMLDKNEQLKANIFKNGSPASEQQLGQPYGSVLFETSMVNLCCGTTESKALNANKINFKAKRQEVDPKDGRQSKSPFICDFMSSTDISNAPSYLKSKLPNYKINPIHSIKNLNDTTESSKDGKKGIKLLGFNSCFTPRND